jgi:sulfate transport system ATP-binding protein
VVKHYGGAGVLHGIDLEAATGEFLALLGPSGSGKTTLLRLIAGLEQPDGGQIAIAGQDMAGVPAQARGVGMVFQNYALFRHMRVADNIAFGLRVRPRATRPAERQIGDRVRELLDLVQMPELAARYPDQLSGGQRQRVALARALAIEPRVLLLDEPFGALDAGVRRDLRRWLRRLHERVGLTTVMVTHDQHEALELADRVAVLRAGALQQVDTPDRLQAAPATRFVDMFLGEAVAFDCVVTDGLARFAGATIDAVRVSRPDGPAVAVLRGWQIGLSEGGLDAALVRSIGDAGPLIRLDVEIGDRLIEVLLPPGAPRPDVGARCRLDVRAARFYGTD